MMQWMHNARDANICVMKKPKEEENQYEGFNPLAFFSTTFDTIRKTIVRIGKKFSSGPRDSGGVDGEDEDRRMGTEQRYGRYSDEVEASEHGRDEDSPRVTCDLGGSTNPHPAFSTRLRHHEETEL